MTPEALAGLIGAGKTMTVELKSQERAPLNDRDLVEAVACLANRSEREPSYLLIGVEDNGRVAGARHRHGDTTNPHKLAALPGRR